MSKKTKAPVIVHLRKGKHKTQPWKVRIDLPGNNPVRELSERYSVRRSAYRAALRNLGLWDSTPCAANKGPWAWNGHPVKFVTT